MTPAGGSSSDLVLTPGATWAQLAAPLRALLHEGRPGRVVVQTSGSTGTPKRVALSAAALRASGEGTAQVLGGPGAWLLALPTHHVAGLQVVARSVLAGTEPATLDPSASFTAQAFVDAAARLPRDRPRYVSLVPTQLHRLLDDRPGTEAARSFTAILLGGAAADPTLLAQAQEAGLRVVTTYGMSETCGGCVYDGVPLPGVEVRVDEDQRIRLGGPVLADGYLDAPALTAQRFVQDPHGRWFVTDDRGVCRADRLVVLGRLDDVIVSGGHKVEPRDVEAALLALPQVADALVVGVPDPEWGQRVAALVVPATPTTAGGPDPDVLRDALRHTLPPHAVPRQIEFGVAIPMLTSGKPDVVRARDLLGRGGRMTAHPL